MPERVVSALDPSFRAQELSFVVMQIGANTGVQAAAARRGWVARVLGRQPPGFTGLLSSVGERARAHLEPSSIWLHNSLRGAVALALAVLVADLSDVQHGFWVAFGALSVLRSNALATGQNTLRAVVGTSAGFVIGGALVYLIGTNTTVLWILLPFAVLFAGIAPAAISFTAGQAAFTMVLLILFNIIAPAGWQIGLIRIEDVAIGCAVSLARRAPVLAARRRAVARPRARSWPTRTASPTWPRPSSSAPAAVTRSPPPRPSLHDGPRWRRLPRPAGSTTRFAATWPTAASSRSRWSTRPGS